jgi:hypothetical protein
LPPTSRAGEEEPLTIDRNEAAQALSDIDDIAARVRQSRIYNLSSLILIYWGSLMFVTYLVATFLERPKGLLWVGSSVIGVVGTLGISLFVHEKSGVRSFDLRVLAAFAIFFGFGLFWAVGIARLPGRELNAFWATYWMLLYSIAGLWLGFGFLAIGLGITALTLIGYFFAGSWFELWMAFVNGGGLILGGLWMRRS